MRKIIVLTHQVIGCIMYCSCIVPLVHCDFVVVFTNYTSRSVFLAGAALDLIS